MYIGWFHCHAVKVWSGRCKKPDEAEGRCVGGRSEVETSSLRRRPASSPALRWLNQQRQLEIQMGTNTRWATLVRVNWLRHGWCNISCLGFWRTPFLLQELHPSKELEKSNMEDVVGGPSFSLHTAKVRTNSTLWVTLTETFYDFHMLQTWKKNKGKRLVRSIAKKNRAADRWDPSHNVDSSQISIIF